MDWCFGLVMYFNGPGTDSGFADKFNRRDEEVKVSVPFCGVQVVEFFGEGGMLESLIAEVLPDVSPVFIFNVCIVVFVIGSCPGEADGFFSVCEVADEMPI